MTQTQTDTTINIKSVIKAAKLDYTIRVSHNVDFAMAENQFYCHQCGCKAYWNGGRYNKKLAHMAEVIECPTCGRTTDKRAFLAETQARYFEWQTVLQDAINAEKASVEMVNNLVALKANQAAIDTIKASMEKTPWHKVTLEGAYNHLSALLAL